MSLVFHELVDELQRNKRALSGASTSGEVIELMTALTDVLMDLPVTISNMRGNIEVLDRLPELLGGSLDALNRPQTLLHIFLSQSHQAPPKTSQTRPQRDFQEPPASL